MELSPERSDGASAVGIWGRASLGGELPACKGSEVETELGTAEEYQGDQYVWRRPRKEEQWKTKSKRQEAKSSRTS